MNDLEKFDYDITIKTLEVKEIFFDFEGTVVDFQWQLVPAVEECLTALGKAGFAREWYGIHPSYAHIYNHTLHLARQGKGTGDLYSAMAVIDRIYDKYDADALSRWNLYPDTLNVLETLKKQRFRMGIISNIGEKSLRTAMDRLDLTSRLDLTISRNDVKHLKPHPEGLLKAAETLKVDPAQCIFVGDQEFRQYQNRHLIAQIK